MRAYEEVDRERLWQHLEALCVDIGPRLSGTPADERSIIYIADHFRRCGAEVEVQDFACPGWEHRATELSLLGPGGLEALPATAQTFTLGCDLEAPLAAAGTWQELDLAPGLEGKALLLYGDAATGLAQDRNATLLSVEERRAAAVIAVSPQETVATKLIRDPFLSAPAVAVPQSVGQRLRERAGATVRLRIDARRYPSTGHNVIARIPGRDLDGDLVAIAAHYDSAALVPGATDNASGTAAILELCQVFGAAPRDLGLEIVAFGADEYGRHRGGALGAAEYVRRHPGHVRRARAVVEADGVGTIPRRPRVRLIGWPPGRREGVLDVLARFPEYGVNDQSGQPDARPTAFNLPGVPAAAFVDDYRFLPIHTPADTVDLMHPDGLLLATQTIAAVVEHLAAGGGAETPRQG